MSSKFVVLIAVILLLAADYPAQAGVDPPLKCKEARAKAAGLKTLMLMKAFGKNIKKPNATKLGSDISKAQSNFTKLFTKPEAKGWCDPPIGDVGGVEVEVDECVECLVGLINGQPCGDGGTAFPATGQTTPYQADKNDGIPGPVDVPDDGTLQVGAPLNYVDNGDGTITDLITGLMWEKKSDDGSIHDKDQSYVWSGNGSEETVWDWLDDVNAEGGTGFAGHSDWRIPNVRELQSIIDYERHDPSVDPMFNTNCTGACTVTTCSCTQAYFYWSSTTYATLPGSAWSVSFFEGSVFLTYNGYVRAVRGGL